MKKFKKIDWFYAICAYFMMFGLIGILFNSISIVMPWSISIFIILYLVYWIIRYIKDMKDGFLIEMEIMKEQSKKDIK
jgi:hypothetical protein